MSTKIQHFLESKKCGEVTLLRPGNPKHIQISHKGATPSSLTVVADLLTPLSVIFLILHHRLIEIHFHLRASDHADKLFSDRKFKFRDFEYRALGWKKIHRMRMRKADNWNDKSRWKAGICIHYGTASSRLANERQEGLLSVRLLFFTTLPVRLD